MKRETNMEHFRGEIEKMKYSFGFINGEIKSCGGCCWDCEFHPKNREGNHTVCSPYKLQWLMSEYKPEPVLTAKEKHFVEFAQEGWLARNSSNKLIFHKVKPTKREYMWISFRNSCTLGVNLFGDMFPFITWEDEEPWSVEELRKLKVKGGASNE